MHLTANQLLIFTNLESFNSSGIYLDIIIIPPHSYKFFFVVVEVYLQDNELVLVRDDFNQCDLFRWVEGVTVNEVIFSSFNSLTII